MLLIRRLRDPLALLEKYVGLRSQTRGTYLAVKGVSEGLFSACFLPSADLTIPLACHVADPIQHHYYLL